MLELFVASQLETDPVPRPKAWAAMLGPDRPEAEQERLAAFVERVIAERMPIWKRLGAL
jgi:hypothetical protein